MYVLCFVMESEAKMDERLFVYRTAIDELRRRIVNLEIREKDMHDVMEKAVRALDENKDLKAELDALRKRLGTS